METHEPIIFHKKRDFTELFNAVFDFLRQEFRPFFKRLFVVMLPVQLLLNIVIGYALWKYSASLAYGRVDFLYFLVMAFVQYIYIVFFASAVYSYLEEYILGDTYEKGIFEKALSVFGRILPMGILAFLLIIISFFITSIIIGLFIRSTSSLAPYYIYLTLFFWFFLLMPFLFMFIIKIVEKRNPFKTLARCYRIARGFWWRTFGSLLLLSIIQGIFSFIFYLPSLLIRDIAGLFGVNIITEGSYVYIFLQVFSSFGTYFSVTIFIYIALQYFNILERKEGHSLINLVHGLKAENNNPEQENDGAGYNPNPEMN